MKIFSAEQIKAWDQYTIVHAPISSVDLMEKAAEAFVHQLLILYPHKDFLTFCGSGNNGGDGLAIARLLLQENRQVEVWLLKEKDLSPDAQINFDRLLQLDAKLKIITNASAIEESEWLRINAQQQVLIDALLGTGLNRPAKEGYAEFIHRINATQKKIVAVDIPSGLYADETVQDDQVIVRASETITFQIPKRSFFEEKNQAYTGDWYVVNIDLSQTYERQTATPFYYTSLQEIKNIYRPRSPFANKGNFGKALLMAGSYGMMGAAVIAARACLRSGVGLLKVYTPACGMDILQTTVPEAMVLTDASEKDFSTSPDTSAYQAIAVGPGWHESEQAFEILKELFLKVNVPMVIDAGALNLLSKDQALLQQVPKGSILTPHKKEFDRLAGKILTRREQEELALQWAKQFGIHFILKGKYSAVVLSDETIHYNTTGNAGMAKGGSGDCLTGILLALLAQGYTPQQAALFGPFLHGYAGDKAAERYSQEAMLPSDLMECIGVFFQDIQAIL
ncbi:MAG: bifunctional ADP-dependent NAD(P)H-hydrate dehydratase/NAD(P)H-hydrate epimerase [Chitinophagaceae bacterium]|nr:bifunctional ADP-dependent NAD(P)H-hydrate dehydratase/NAD(P)H-hydrate epimerase [Chitinophagaceae bacterium]